MPDVRILITGGLGYIGGRIADFLKRNRPESTIILGTSRKNTEIPRWAKRFEVIRLNIRDQVSIEKAVSNDIHIVVHLVAMNESYSLNYIKFVRETNTLGRQSLLSASCENKVQNLYIFPPSMFAKVFRRPLPKNRQLSLTIRMRQLTRLLKTWFVFINTIKTWIHYYFSVNSRMVFNLGHYGRYYSI